MHQHDPVSFVAGFASRLATRSRHVCMLLGAGVGRACGLPDVKGLEEAVSKSLRKEDRSAFESQLAGRNLEQALTRIRRIQALLDDGSGEIDGLTASRARQLDGAVCREIVAALDLKKADLDPMRLFAAWVRRADYHRPLEIFTVNYDLLVETALEESRTRYFDGFVGSLRAPFHTELVEEWPSDEMPRVPAEFVRLWKLHGSVNWAWIESPPQAEVVRLGQPVLEGDAAAIYPSDTKYVESRRMPFVVLQDRFRRGLRQPETLVVISGYSFSDEHLNELIFDAASQRQRSEFVTFSHSAISDNVAERALQTPNFQALGPKEAIIGGIRGDWREPEETPPGIWSDGLALGDFRHLAAYLARSIIRDIEPVTGEQLERLLHKIEGEPEGTKDTENARDP